MMIMRHLLGTVALQLVKLPPIALATWRNDGLPRHYWPITVASSNVAIRPMAWRGKMKR